MISVIIVIYYVLSLISCTVERSKKPNHDLAIPISPLVIAENKKRSRIAPDETLGGINRVCLSAGLCSCNPSSTINMVSRYPCNYNIHTKERENAVDFCMLDAKIILLCAPRSCGPDPQWVVLCVTSLRNNHSLPFSSLAFLVRIEMIGRLVLD